MTYDPVAAVLEKLECVTPNGPDGWMARCKSHEDNRPSLSVRRAENGSCHLKCFAGCDNKDIVASIGMTMAELFTDYGQKQQQPERKQPSSSRVVARYDYFDEGRNLLYQVRRMDNKQFPQYRPDGKGGWTPGLSKDTRRVLFRLPEFLEADLCEPVFITEGEKDVLNLVKLGLIATSKSGGSNGIWPKDLNHHFQGRHVVVVCDNDEPGRASADGICRQLKNVAKSLKLLDLAHHWEGMPVKADVTDWLEKAGGNRSKLLELVDRCPEWEFTVDEDVDDIEDGEDVGEVLQHDKFPTHCLPFEWGRIASECSDSIGVDPSFLAMPMLSIAAGMVGGSATMKGKGGWEEPCVLWCLLVADSGEGKTPSLNFLKAPVDELEREDVLEWRKRYATWKSDSEEYQRSKKKKSGIPDDISEPGPEPQCPRLVIQDTTQESTVPILANNEAGLLLINDELSGWLASFGAYNKGRAAADMAFWNQAFSGTSYRNDRKGSGHITLRKPLLSVCGAVQPSMMSQVLGSEHKASGLLARLLIAWPPKRIFEWSDREIDWGTKEDYKRLITRLLGFRRGQIRPFTHLGTDVWQGENNLVGEVDPMVFEFTEDAKPTWIAYYNAIKHEKISFTGDLSSAWAKLPSMVLRIALTLHLMEWAEGKDESPSYFVKLETLQNAICIVDWLKVQTRKLYAIFASNNPGLQLERQKEDREQAEADWLKNKIIEAGGEVQYREFYKNKTKWTSKHALEVFSRIEAESWGTFQERRSPSGQLTKWFTKSSP